MSRISLSILILFVATPVAASAKPLAPLVAPDPIAKYEAFVSVVVKRCIRPANDREIMVCGRRNADRYRVPFTGYAVGDPRGETVVGERVRLQHQTTTCQDLGPFQIKCGMVGVHASAGFGEGGLTFRTPAD